MPGYITMRNFIEESKKNVSKKIELISFNNKSYENFQPIYDYFLETNKHT
jgi:hypothetical protein